MQKHLLIPSRVRQVPRQFSWVDQRLVRDHHLARCDAHAWALYLFLVIVADARGLSYYADDSVGRLLSLDKTPLTRARQALISADLIAYEAPLYQVLALEPATLSVTSRACDTTRAASTGLRRLREVLRQTVEGTS